MTCAPEAAHGVGPVSLPGPSSGGMGSRGRMLRSGPTFPSPPKIFLCLSLPEILGNRGRGKARQQRAHVVSEARGGERRKG